MMTRRFISILLTLVYIASGASVPLVRCEVPNGHVQVEYVHRACPELDRCDSQSAEHAAVEVAPRPCRDTPIRSAEWTSHRGPDDDLRIAMLVEASPINLFESNGDAGGRLDRYPACLDASCGVVLRAIRTVVLTV